MKWFKDWQIFYTYTLNVQNLEGPDFFWKPGTLLDTVKFGWIFNNTISKYLVIC